MTTKYRAILGTIHLCSLKLKARVNHETENILKCS